MVEEVCVKVLKRVVRLLWGCGWHVRAFLLQMLQLLLVAVMSAVRPGQYMDAFALAVILGVQCAGW